MDAMKKAIQKRRMNRLSDMEMEKMMSDDMGAEGSMDELAMADKEKSTSLAPETEASMEMENEDAEHMDKMAMMDDMKEDKQDLSEDEQMMMMAKLYNKDDMGKPGIRGKAEALMRKAMGKG